MLPADRPERPQIKGVCSDLRKCHGCQTPRGRYLPFFVFSYVISSRDLALQFTMTTRSVKSVCRLYYSGRPRDILAFVQGRIQL